MKVFKAEDWFEAEIKEVEIDGMTEKFVRFRAGPSSFNQKREKIESSYHRYCKSHGEAKEWLLSRAERSLESCKQRIKSVEEKLEKIKKL